MDDTIAALLNAGWSVALFHDEADATGQITIQCITRHQWSGQWVSVTAPTPIEALNGAAAAVQDRANDPDLTVSSGAP